MVIHSVVSASVIIGCFSEASTLAGGVTGCGGRKKKYFMYLQRII